MLVGLNWYGYTYSAKKHAEALLGSDYIALLKKHNPRITYDDEVHEHTFTVKDGRCAGMCTHMPVWIRQSPRQGARRRRCGFRRCSQYRRALSWPGGMVVVSAFGSWGKDWIIGWICCDVARAMSGLDAL